MPNETFSQWIFNSMIENGIILDYDKNPHTGKGRTPIGNLSLKLDQIYALRQSSDLNAVLWGLIAVSLTNNGQGKVGTRLNNQFLAFAAAYCALHPEMNSQKVYDVMILAASCAGQEWKHRFVPASEMIEAEEVA